MTIWGVVKVSASNVPQGLEQQLLEIIEEFLDLLKKVDNLKRVFCSSNELKN